MLCDIEKVRVFEGKVNGKKWDQEARRREYMSREREVRETSR